MLLSIIIPTRNRGAVFDETLQAAINAIKHLDGEILVVNDFHEKRPSIPDSSNVRIIDNPGRGVAAARNAGVRSTTGEIILFLDDDIVISGQSIDHIISVHREMKDLCLNVNWEYPPDMMKQISKTQFGRFLIASRMTSFKGWYNDASWKENELFPSKAVASFHLSMRRTDFERTPGYNETFPHAGFEDYAFPQELKKARLSLFIDARTTVYHNEIDRMNFDNWLANQERRAITRKVAVELGYSELALNYTTSKRVLLSIIGAGIGIIRAMIYAIPNLRFFDPLFFKLVGALEAHKIYRGYTLH